MWWQSWMSGKTLSATWLQYTFTSSNLTCYHTEFVNTGQFFLPPLCKLSRWSTCKIPGVCRNSWSAPGSTGKPMGWKSEIIHHTTETHLFCKQMCWLRRAACHCPSVVTVPTAPPWQGQLGPPHTDSGKGNQVNAMHRQIIPCKLSLTKTLHGAIKLCLCTYCSTHGHWNWSWKLWKESCTSWKILIRLSLNTFHLPGLSRVHFKDVQGFIKGLNTSIKVET